MGLLSGPI